jgi:sugar lactone lactonase YvrE
MVARRVLEARDLLGEGPLWCPVEQALYWIDSSAPAIHRWAPESGATRTWAMPSVIGSMALRAGGGAVVALENGFAFVDFESGAVEPLLDPEAAQPGTRFNDGKCDRRGRFWAGTMDRAMAAPLGALYRLDPDLGCRPMVEGVTVANGLGWSPDDRTMYHTDSPARRIHAFDFDLEAGALSNRRVFVELAEGVGFPDGLTVDAEGFVWSAIWRGGRVERYAPDGRLERAVELPIKRPTSCIFGGPNLDRLYVTSASSRDGREPEPPPAGALFVIEAGVKGLPEPRFAG